MLCWFQVNDSASWEQKGVWRSKCEEGCWSQTYRLLQVSVVELRRSRQDLFILVLGNILTLTGLSQLIFMSELVEAIMWISLFLSSVDLHCEQHLQTDLPYWQSRGKAFIFRDIQESDLSLEVIRLNWSFYCETFSLLWCDFLRQFHHLNHYRND